MTESDDKRSVFLNNMPSYDEALNFEAEEEKYEKLFNVRDDVMKALELARAEKTIGKSLDAKVVIYGDEKNEAMKLFAENKDLLETVFIVSKVELSNGTAPETAHSETEHGISVEVVAAEGEKCVRCWMYTTEGVADEDGQVLCPKCREALK